MSDRLIVKFTRIGNVVVGEIVEQGQSIKRGCGEFYTATNGFKLASYKYPILVEGSLCVRGTIGAHDQRYDALTCCITQDAINYITRATAAVREYNAKNAPAKPATRDGIDVTFAV